jgi:hypothetical protein
MCSLTRCWYALVVCVRFFCFPDEHPVPGRWRRNLSVPSSVSRTDGAAQVPSSWQRGTARACGGCQRASSGRPCHLRGCQSGKRYRPSGAQRSDALRFLQPAVATHAARPVLTDKDGRLACTRCGQPITTRVMEISQQPYDTVCHRLEQMGREGGSVPSSFLAKRSACPTRRSRSPP